MTKNLHDRHVPELPAEVATYVIEKLGGRGAWLNTSGEAGRGASIVAMPVLLTRSLLGACGNGWIGGNYEVTSSLFCVMILPMAIAAAPRTPKGRATRERLIACAREVAVANDGHLEIAWVAQAAGVVPSLVNRYFGSRAGLVSAAVKEFFDRLHTEVLDLDLDEHGTWAQRERLRLEKGVHFHYADPFAVVLYTRLSRDPEVAETENRHIDTVIQHAAANVRRGQKRGELPRSVDPEFAGAAMFGAMQRVMVVALGRTPRPKPERVIDVLWRQVAASVEIDPYAELRTPTRSSR